MKVQIFSAMFLSDYSGPLVENFQKQVNEFLQKHPTAKVEWHQTSAGSHHRVFTILTAIVSYDNSATKTTNPS